MSGLCVKLGHRHGNHPEYEGPKQETSSRQRRRMRRAATRLAKEVVLKETTEEVVLKETNEEVVSVEDINKVEAETNDEKCEAIESAADDYTNTSGKTIANEEKVTNIIEEEAEIATIETVETHEEVQMVGDADAESRKLTTSSVAYDVSKNSDRKDNFEAVKENFDDVKAIASMSSQSEESVRARPAVETVFATAVISHSLSSQVTDRDINNLLRIVRRKEHLNQNIVSVDIGSVKSYNEKGNKFEHNVQMMIHVKTVNLWESSRSYIYHHMGKDIWDLQDGTEISLRRIHQKN